MIASELRKIKAELTQEEKLKWCEKYPTDTHQKIPVDNIFVPAGKENKLYRDRVEAYKTKKDDAYAEQHPLQGFLQVIVVHDGHGMEFKRYQKLTDKPMKTNAPKFYVMDGVHRCTAQAEQGKEYITVYIAREPQNYKELSDSRNPWLMNKYAVNFNLNPNDILLDYCYVYSDNKYESLDDLIIDKILPDKMIGIQNRFRPSVHTGDEYIYELKLKTPLINIDGGYVFEKQRQELEKHIPELKSILPKNENEAFYALKDWVFFETDKFSGINKEIKQDQIKDFELVFDLNKYDEELPETNTELSYDAFKYLKAFMSDVGANPSLSIDVLKELEQYAPKKPIHVYRGMSWDDYDVKDLEKGVASFPLKLNQPNKLKSRRPTSWTTNIYVAREFTESKYCAIFEATLTPDQILMDTRQLPEKTLLNLYQAKQREIIAKPGIIDCTVKELYIRDSHQKYKTVEEGFWSKEDMQKAASYKQANTATTFQDIIDGFEELADKIQDSDSEEFKKWELDNSDHLTDLIEYAKEDDEDADETEIALEEFNNRYTDFFYDFKQKADVTDEGFIAARKITVPDVDLFIKRLKIKQTIDPTKYKGLGIFWSWLPDKAQAHWGHYSNNEKEVLIEGILPFSSIDIERTFYHNVNLALGEDEAELTLIEGKPIKVTAVKESKRGLDLLDEELSDIAANKIASSNPYTDSTQVPWKINTGKSHEVYAGDGLRFNVDAAKQILKEKSHKIIPIDPEEWVYSDHFTGLKYSETKESNLNIPIIVTEIRGVKYVLDGWHRITKAFHEHIESIPSVELTEQEAMQILLRKRKN